MHLIECIYKTSTEVHPGFFNQETTEEYSTFEYVYATSDSCVCSKTVSWAWTRIMISLT